MSDAVTQTDILDEQNAELVATQTELGTSPSGAYTTVAARFTSGLPKSFTAAGNAAAGFIAEGTIATLVVPAQTTNGNLLVWGLCFVSKTVAGDVFTARIRDTNLVGAELGVSQWSGMLQNTGTPMCSVAMTATVAKTVVMTLQIAGTGSGTAFNGPSPNQINALWTPT